MRGDVFDLVVALESLALGAKREAAAALPPGRSKAAALTGPNPAQEFFWMHRGVDLTPSTPQWLGVGGFRSSAH